MRKDNQNVKGEYLVYIQYALDRKIAKDKTDVWVKEKEWNDKAQKVRSVHPQSINESVCYIIANKFHLIKKLKEKGSYLRFMFHKCVYLHQ